MGREREGILGLLGLGDDVGRHYCGWEAWRRKEGGKKEGRGRGKRGRGEGLLGKSHGGEQGSHKKKEHFF